MSLACYFNCADLGLIAGLKGMKKKVLEIHFVIENKFEFSVAI